VAVLLVILFAAAWLRGAWRPRCTLLELADKISGPAAAHEPALRMRLERQVAQRAAAGPPPTPEEERALMDMDMPTPRFAVSDAPQWLSYLEVHGYAVVDLELPPTTLARLKSLLWEFLESHADGWRRGQPDTWTDEGLCCVGSPLNGILNGRGVGHSDFLWAVRTLPVVRDAFAHIWNVAPDALATSFDGANVFRPWSPHDNNTANRQTQGGWWHVDQGRGKAGLRCAVQGLVTLFDADAGTGGLCVVPGSHTWHSDVVQDAPYSHDFVMVPPHWPGFTALPRRRLVHARAGDLVLW
jgi:hypothetical protein